jgi:hypothetical protein
MRAYPGVTEHQTHWVAGYYTEENEVKAYNSKNGDGGSGNFPNGKSCKSF